MDYRIDIEGKIGKNPEDIKHVWLQAMASNQIEKLFVEYNNGNVTIKERDTSDIEKFTAAVKDFLRSVGAKTRGEDGDWSIARNKGKDRTTFRKLEQMALNPKVASYDFSVVDPEVEDATNVKVANDDTLAYADVKLDEAASKTTVSEEDFSTRAKRKTLGFAIGGLALASGIGAFSWFNNRGTALAEPKTKLETATEDLNEIDQTTTYGQKVEIDPEVNDYDFYVENAEDTLQKQRIMKYHDVLMAFNGSDYWMDVELSDEVKQGLEQFGNYAITDDKAVFGLTADEAFALDVCLSDYSDEELTVLTNGEGIDIDKVKDSAHSDYNKAIDKAISFYLNPDTMYEGHFVATKVAGKLSEEGNAAITDFETDLFQIKQDMFVNGVDEATLNNELKAFKTKMGDYLDNPDIEDNKAKEYIAKAIVPAWSVLCNVVQATDKVTVHLYVKDGDAYQEQYKDVELEMAMADEITTRRWVIGFNECKDEQGNVTQEGFNELEFMKNHKIDSNKYSIVIDDDGVSIADKLNGSDVSRFTHANEAITQKRQDNLVADNAYAAANGTDEAYVNNNTEFDSLTKYTYNMDTLLSLVNDALRLADKYPRVIEYFTSWYSEFVKAMVDYKDKHGITAVADAVGKVVKQLSETMTVYYPGSTYTYWTYDTVTNTWTETTTTYRTVTVHNDNWENEYNALPDSISAKDKHTTVIDGATGQSKDTTYQDIINRLQNTTLNYDGTDKSQLSGDNFNTNLDGDDIINTNDPVVRTIQDEIDKNARELEENRQKLEEESNNQYTDDQGVTHYETGGEVTITNPDYQDVTVDPGSGDVTQVINNNGEELDVVSEDEAARYNAQLNGGTTTETYTAPVEGFTTDWTPSESFAPAVETYSVSSAAPVDVDYSASYSDVDEVIQEVGGMGK